MLKKLVLSAVVVAGSIHTAAAQDVTLRAAHIESTESATHRAYERFASLVDEKTNGAVEVQVFPAGQLGGLRDLYEGIKLGSVDITSSGPDYTANLAPVMVVAALYYSYDDVDHADRALDGEFGARLSDALARDAGMRVLAWGELGFRSVFNTERPINTVGDFSGMKIRVPEAQLHLLPMKALGASPTPIPYAEVYTAMQTGIVDGAEGTPAVVKQQRFDEVSKYYSLTRHLFNPIHLVVSARKFDGLTPEQQAAVTEAAREAFAEQRREARADNEAALEALRGQDGIEVNEPSREEMRSAVEPTWNELIAPLGDEGQQLLQLLLDARDG
ncbi:TRAP transporter substrate-binding protein [Acuticoccus kandeliae]|uniref:TRAP transporter substrate-binding protein n=1 Tax=Acuticoccus kandeliae TaxID=2073160 RepID=UPI000D3EA630|nr:TRAP transporter substrate-binding protein [Acuticoccus kandeliae]